MTRELKTKDEILEIFENSWHDGDMTRLPPMFHGTDASLVEITKSERDSLYQACDIIISRLFSLFKANSISDADERLQKSRDSYGRSSTAYRFAESRLKKSPFYSYGDYYVSNSPNRAIIYSKEAWICGETGWCANRLIEGANAVGLDLPDDAAFLDAFAKYNARKQREKEPVVIMVTNASSSDWYMETGYHYADMQKERFEQVLMDLKNAFFMAESYRLGNVSEQNGQQFYMIKEDHFPDLLNAWNLFQKTRQ
ncbi:MAG: hypothetical protein II743_03295 [Lachnospiraceae bacterium]|nr:hypothetical protein [Lachnospiraceae bacterium]